MPSLWAKGDSQVGLHVGNLYETAYPRNYLPHMRDSWKPLMTRDEIDLVASNIFEHPYLDLDAIFQDFRLSGHIATKHTLPITALLQECQDDIKLLDVKIRDTISAIAKLSRYLAQTSARLVQKVSQVRLCRYLLSSPKHLPQDVLEEIFLASLATNDDPSPHPNCPPLQLAAICHRWRTITLSMPTLWNGLYLSSGTPSEIELAKLWASRSYLPTLTLEFDTGGLRVGVESSSMLDQLFDTLRGPSRSPRRIDLVGWKGHFRDVLTRFLLKRDHLVLDEFVHRDSSRTLWALPSLPRAPSLRRVYTHLPPPIWRHSPPPSQLTVLWLTSKIHCDTLVIFLVKCPNLESLYVEISESGLQFSPKPVVSRDITIRQLKYFGLWNGYGSKLPEDLLHRLTFPSLRVVEYCGLKRRTQDSTLWLGFSHALDPVQRLTLQFHDAIPSMDTITHLLERAPSITELSISTTDQFMPDIITCLTSLASGSINQTVVLPSLRAIYLHIAFSSLTQWLFFQSQLTEFGTSWTTPQSSGPQRIHPLAELVIQHRYDGFVHVEERNEAWQASEVKQMLHAACPDLRIRIVCIENISWLGNVPASFEMFPLPFNGRHFHGTMEDDDSWIDQVGPHQRVMS
ncbi:hypothetical protein BDN72DRAFT_963197 [Pluteus cervinus]|uniref:Uncharacterized protein n=1 Tax=Pluteus cervinus TaxID=181527 RepID=A0ACD3AFH2_9AGAR|nr:hypothetical protein BDN72DRAFT_963197 [Pluteus cervinus]